MPRDRRPQYKKQIRIKNRTVGIPKGMTKDVFMKVHEFDQNEFEEKGYLFHGRSNNEKAYKAAARARGLNKSSDIENYEHYQKITKNKQLEVDKGDC
tara:strand:+ start:597 stop:887 length:291 start_codon:yes stop_codon:yes gene_type:complete